MSRNQFLIAAASIAAFSIGVKTPAQAQIATNQPSGPNAVEEIVVTAQRREERLQDVPISVSAITAAGLQKQGVSTTFDLVNAVPGWVFSKSSAGRAHHVAIASRRVRLAGL